MKEVTDLLDQTHLFLPKSVVIICKNEKIDVEPCPISNL